MRFFKRYFITGLLIWIPLIITVWVIALLISTLESFVPAFLTSQNLFGYRIPGFQVVLVLLVVLVTGLLGGYLLLFPRADDAGGQRSPSKTAGGAAGSSSATE